MSLGVIHLIHIDSFFPAFCFSIFAMLAWPALAVEGFARRPASVAENRTKVFVAVRKVSGGKVECCPKERVEGLPGQREEDLAQRGSGDLNK